MNVPPLEYRTLLHETLSPSAAQAPDKLAISASDGTCTFRQLDEWSNGIAANLRERGVRRGDRVGIFLDNTVAAAVAVYGVLKAGAVFVLVNPLTKAGKLAFVANDCEVRALITDTHLHRVLQEATPRIPSLTHLVLTGAPRAFPAADGGDLPVVVWDDAVASGGPEAIRDDVIPTDLASLIYTSGSTGHPKGVMHTHQSMVFALGSVREYLRLRHDDVLLNVLPLAFDYGLYQLLMAVSLSASLVLERSFAYPGRIFQHIHEHQVTVFPGVPTVFSLLISAHRREPLSFPSVRWITNTAAALPVDFFSDLREIFPNGEIFPMYGLTECKRVSYLEPELVDEKRGSVGRAIPGTEVLLLSPEGEPVPPGEPGMLYVRGPHLMRGYWRNPERTAEMLVDGHIPGEKFLRTGDWFRLDDDGFLYFLGRSDDIIKTRGEKVSPAEVEDALYSVPGVVEAAVVGVPDEVLGQSIRAFVVVTEESGLEPRRLRKELLDRLENFMVPQEFVLRDSLPRSANGKILKKELV